VENFEKTINTVLNKIGLNNLTVKHVGKSKGFITAGYNLIQSNAGETNNSLIVSVQIKDLLTLCMKLLNEQVSEVNNKVRNQFISFVQVLNRKLIISELKKQGIKIIPLLPIILKSKKLKSVGDDCLNFVVRSEELNFQIKILNLKL
jgi:hypothetical protein